MGRITSSIGLVTGVPIKDTVDQLMKLAARPRDLIASRVQAMAAEQNAVATLTSKVLAFQFHVKNLKKADLFTQQSATSTDPSKLTANVTGAASPGVHQFTPVRTAQAQQLLSSNFASATAPLGEGTLTIRQGGGLDDGISLGQTNGGIGIQRGKIRITDRTGTSAEVDLRFARTVDDVLQAVNTASELAVRLETRGDRFVLVDTSGQTTSNLRVQEVAGGTTAANLGLSGIDVGASEAVGADIVKLYDQQPLSQLNDNRGVRFSKSLPELRVTFRDGSPAISIDFNSVGKVASNSSGTQLAANGVEAQLRFTATASGAAFDGYTVSYVNDDDVTQGSETVEINATAKTLVFQIDDGATTADDIVTALANDSEASAAFTAVRVGSGTAALVSTTDEVVTYGGAAFDEKTEATLGDVLATINEAGQGRLHAEIAPDGERIQITDLTDDLGGSFAITSQFDSKVLADLGITTPASGGVITGERIHGGLKTTLISSLNAAQGLTLGTIDFTDRAGETVSVNLAAAKTIDDVLYAINSQAKTAGVQITASINDAHSGIVLRDTSNSTAGPLIVANGDGTNSADKLGLTKNANVTSVDGGSLKKQTVGEATLLSSLNNGRGIALGKFKIFNSDGLGTTVTLTSESTTVGDLIKEINKHVVEVKARLNATGDGIELVDTAGGSGKLRVVEVNQGSTAADLHLLGTSRETTVGGNPAQVLEGGTRIDIAIDDDDTLTDLVTKINSSGAGLRASKIGDGSAGNPFRISFVGQFTGDQANVLFDTSQVGFTVSQSAKAHDSLLLLGSPANAGASILAASTSDSYGEIVPGVQLRIQGDSLTPVIVNVTTSDTNLLKTAGEFVKTFNDLQSTVDSMTNFDAEANTVGLLIGSTETLRLESDLAGLLTSRFFGAGTFQSLETVGIKIKDNGQLELDAEKFKTAFSSQPEELKRFFTDSNAGVATKLDKLLETMAGPKNSLLLNRAKTLADKVNSSADRVAFMDERLEKQRERLLNDFARMELTIGKLQNNLTALNSIQVFTPLGSTRS